MEMIYDVCYVVKPWTRTSLPKSFKDEAGKVTIRGCKSTDEAKKTFLHSHAASIVAKTIGENVSFEIKKGIAYIQRLDTLSCSEHITNYTDHLVSITPTKIIEYEDDQTKQKEAENIIDLLFGIPLGWSNYFLMYTLDYSTNSNPKLIGSKVFFRKEDLVNYLNTTFVTHGINIYHDLSLDEIKKTARHQFTGGKFVTLNMALVNFAESNETKVKILTCEYKNLMNQNDEINSKIIDISLEIDKLKGSEKPDFDQIYDLDKKRFDLANQRNKNASKINALLAYKKSLHYNK